MRSSLKWFFSAALALTFLISHESGFVRSKPSVAFAQEAICTGPFQPVSPALTDLADNLYVRMDGQTSTFRGGLYPGGSNEPPAEHAAAGLAAAGRIQPLDANGNPDAGDGIIGLVSLGMSNTSAEFGRFMQISRQDPEINPNLVLVNAALGGQTAEDWVDPLSFTWDEMDARLAHYDVSAQQVQVAWIKQTLTGG